MSFRLKAFTLLFLYLSLISNAQTQLPNDTQQLRLLFHPSVRNVFQPGAQISPDSCQGPGQWNTVSTALANARKLVTAATALISSQKAFEKRLFSLFFEENDRPFVRTVFSNLNHVLKNQIPYPVVFTCDDLLSRCNNPSEVWGAYIISGDSGDELHHLSLAPIVICYAFMAQLPALPDPCDSNSFNQVHGQGFSQASLLLHELLHINYLGGPTQPTISDLAAGTYGGYVLRWKNDFMNWFTHRTMRGLRPIDNGDSYLSLAALAYMLRIQRSRCPAQYPLFGQVDRLLGAVPENLQPQSDRQEMRRLLLADLLDAEAADLVNVPSNSTDLVVCDPRICLTCSALPAGTLPTDGCYPPLSTNANNASQAWGITADTSPPPESVVGIDLAHFAGTTCPVAINALCAFIAVKGNTPSNQGKWIWALGESGGGGSVGIEEMACLAGGFLPSTLNHVRYPSMSECESFMGAMKEVVGKDGKWRVGVNLRRFPSMPDGEGLEGGPAVVLEGGDMGVAVDGRVGSWVLGGFEG